MGTWNFAIRSAASRGMVPRRYCAGMWRHTTLESNSQRPETQVATDHGASPRALTCWGCASPHADLPAEALPACHLCGQRQQGGCFSHCTSRHRAGGGLRVCSMLRPVPRHHTCPADSTPAGAGQTDKARKSEHCTSAAECVILTAEDSAPTLSAWSLCRPSTLCLLRAALSPYACHCGKQTSPLRRISVSLGNPHSPSSTCSHVYFKIAVSTMLKSALFWC